MSTIVIKNTRVMQTMPPFTVTTDVDVVITDDVIRAVGKGAGSSVQADKVIDGKGKTVIPGNVCGHHHYYSGLSRGMMISAGPQNDFIQVLKEWWWRLDRGLDEEACYYSSLICSLDAIKAGTTTCIDHHASPNYIAGSLDTIANGMEKVGVRGTTCYEVTDRNFGMKEVEDGVSENISFAKSSKKRTLVRGMIGGHAPFTIPDEGLRLMGEAMRETGAGLHLHVAEDKYDVVHSHHHYNKDIVDRLDSFGLLTPNSLLVHGLWLNGKEIEKINEHDCFFAHNARSNMNNNVGYCQHIQDVKNLIIGTDGCGGNMFEELKLAFFKHKDETGSWWPGDYLTALSRGNKLVEKYFDGNFGRVEAGYKADLAILDYQNPTPLLEGNAAGHFVWGMSSNCVESVIVNGKLVMENHSFPGLDVAEIYAQAAKVAERVWKKVDKIAP
ncbi:putative selenium metabolism protein SsnA [Sphaerochaeta pleomorpha str. Grapes]|uniref:Putative selenium metabolism protein SsnA n=1 Tax=Sphaerochaeta pleomorpha (strain ATCC BAA-1885 / DSM 22778 / Grapes) TaxID=158190 RepID=G8QZ38_SPHPG|nr:putative aminohydrolase SsnA [Sphaerochaeta pleomorpha]AEV30897.1 putative selenium metabolism protein SsnA [Sphaerochaeta pleomorpha str. Grapes]